MAYTYSKIASVTVGSTAVPSIDFIAIPQNYTDLLIKLSLRSDTSGTSRQLTLTLNSNTGANYSTRYVYAYASGTVSGSSSSATDMYAGLYGGTSYTANTFSNIEIYIPNYAGSNNKLVSIDSVMENNSTTNYIGFWSGLWAQTAQINSIKFLGSINFAQYSTATLYGIKAEV